MTATVDTVVDAAEAELEARVRAALANYRHPGWCVPEDHLRAAVSHIDDGHPGVPPHQRHVAGGWVPEIRRCGFDTPATRAKQGTWTVGIEQVDHGRYVDDTVIVLKPDDLGEDEMRLLPSEARELAAALIRAADLELFGT